VIPNSIATQRLDETHLSRRQELRQHGRIVAASRREREGCIHFDPDQIITWREPQLALAGEQHAPGFVFLPADQGVLAVGAETPVGSGLASGTGQAVDAAGLAVFGPPARLEVPAAEGPDPFFAAFNNTWRRVNSWKNRSPTG
jgi:hypothetical protein